MRQLIARVRLSALQRFNALSRLIACSLRSAPLVRFGRYFAFASGFSLHRKIPAAAHLAELEDIEVRVVLGEVSIETLSL
jgi:hypothetical protein